MITVAPSNPGAPTRTIDPAHATLTIVRPLPDPAQIPPTLLVSSMLNALFDEGISWEDAEWR